MNRAGDEVQDVGRKMGVLGSRTLEGFFEWSSGDLGGDGRSFPGMSVQLDREEIDQFRIMTDF